MSKLKKTRFKVYLIICTLMFVANSESAGIDCSDMTEGVPLHLMLLCAGPSNNVSNSSETIKSNNESCRSLSREEARCSKDIRRYSILSYRCAIWEALTRRESGHIPEIETWASSMTDPEYIGEGLNERLCEQAGKAKEVLELKYDCDYESITRSIRTNENGTMHTIMIDPRGNKIDYEIKYAFENVIDTDLLGEVELLGIRNEEQIKKAIQKPNDCAR